MYMCESYIIEYGQACTDGIFKQQVSKLKIWQYPSKAKTNTFETIPEHHLLTIHIIVIKAWCT